MRICLLCNKKHMAKGFCEQHYLEQYRNDPEHKKRSSKLKHDWYEKNKDLNHMKLQREQRHFDGKREFVLERDKYQCQKCGATKRLVVHHKDGKGRSTKTPNNSLKNLETLCKPCHVNVHREELYSVRKTRKNGFWSKNYDQCIECGSNEQKHNSHGLCGTCYARSRRN